jgi:hypothetical protein
MVDKSGPGGGGQPKPHQVFRARKRSTPQCPIIRFGPHAGRAVRDLSDVELRTFLKRDARRQTQSVLFLLGFDPAEAPDLSHYWYGKYEMDRRKHEPQPRASTHPVVEPHDRPENIVRKLFQYGLRMASLAYHPDHGGNTAIMQRINAARELFHTVFQSGTKRR